MIASITDTILGLHGWGALVVVFLLPALESSAFVGFVFPGEIAVLLGGVLAYQHKVSLPAVLVAAIAGAIVGDSIGYEVGKRWGRRLLHGTVGRIVKHEHLDRAERYLADRGGKAVFLGRFTAALRVLIPGLAGMSGLEYRTFLAYNAAAGAIWATGFVLLGYGAGSSWRQVEHIAGRASLVLLLLVIVAAAVVWAGRWVTRNQQFLVAFAARQSEQPLVARSRARYRRQLDFLRRRLRPEGALGLSLTVALATIVAGGWLLGVVAQDVIAGDDAGRLDGPVLDWFVSHRTAWLTTLMRVITTGGASGLLIPLALTIGIIWWWRRGTPRALALLAGAYAGSDLLFRAIKALTNRARPPASLAVGHFSGSAFPSGHAAQATAVFGMLAALIAAATPSWRRKVTAWAAAAFITAVVGISRLYLGGHWFTDVLGGSALGATWLALLLGAVRATAAIRSPKTPDPTNQPRRVSTPSPHSPDRGQASARRVLRPLYAAGFVTAFGAHSVAANLGGYATGHPQTGVRRARRPDRLATGVTRWPGRLRRGVSPVRRRQRTPAARRRPTAPRRGSRRLLARGGRPRRACRRQRERGRSFGGYGAAKGLGYLAGPIGGGLLVAVGGYRLLFIVLAALALVVAGVAARFVPVVAPTPRPRETLVGLVHRLSSPTFLRPVAVLAAATAALSAGVGFLPVTGARAHLGPIVTGASVSLLAACAALVQPRAGRALDAGRIPTNVASWALVAAALGLALPAVAHGPVVLAAAAVLIGIGVRVATPLGFAALAQTAPPGRMGETMGAAEVGRELGDAGGPLVVGALSIIGLAAGFAGLAVLVLGSALGAVRRTENDRSRPTDAPDSAPHDQPSN